MTPRRLFVEPEVHDECKNLPGMLDTTGIDLPTGVELRRLRIDSLRVVYAINEQAAWPRCTFLALCLFTAASCATPNAETLPDGYRRVSRSGVTVYFRPGDEAFVDEVFPAVHEARARFLPALVRLQGTLRELEAQQRLAEAKLLDGGVGERLLDHIAAMLQSGEPERQKMRRIWTTFTRIQPLLVMKQGLDSALKIASLDRVRIVTAEEIVQGRVPLVRYNPATDRWNLRFEARSNGDWQPGDAPAPLKQLSELDLAFPIHRESLPNGTTWSDSLRWFQSSTVDGSTGFGALGSKEFPGLPATGAMAAFLPLHEAAELTLLDTLEINDPLARWFHDGMANYLAHEAIREVLGQDEYDQCAYAPNTAKDFTDAKEHVNLLAWPRLDFDAYRPALETTAHYFFATEEIRGLAERHGRDFIGKLLLALQAEKPVDTEKICNLVKALSGDDLMQRLEAYAPKSGDPAPELESKAVAAFEAGNLTQAIPLLQDLVLQHPRNADLRYDLAMAYLNSDPEQHLPDFLQHYLIYRSLIRARAATPEDPFLIEGQVTAAAMYAVGRLAEEQQHPEGARKHFEKALELDPSHEPSLERLSALQADVER